jgi:hypothetical protein
MKTGFRTMMQLLSPPSHKHFRDRIPAWLT